MSDTSLNSAWGQPAEDPTNGFAGAMAAFRAALQDVYASPDDEQKVTETFEAYATALQEPWQNEALSQQVNDLHAAFVDSIRTAFGAEEQRRRMDAAYESYLGALKSIWQDVDPTALRPEDLISVSQSAAWIGSVMAAIEQAQ